MAVKLPKKTMTDDEILTAVKSALVHQVEKRANVYLHIFEQINDRDKTVDYLHRYWFAESKDPKDVFNGKRLIYKDAVFKNGFILEATKFFKVSQKEAESLYGKLPLDEIQKYEITLEEEDLSK